MSPRCAAEDLWDLESGRGSGGMGGARERLLMAKAFDPDKSWKAELINKMFTLSTLARCSCVRGPSLRRLCQRVYVDALLRCLSVHQANWMLSGFAEWNIFLAGTKYLKQRGHGTSDESKWWFPEKQSRDKDCGLVSTICGLYNNTASRELAHAFSCSFDFYLYNLLHCREILKTTSMWARYV